MPAQHLVGHRLLESSPVVGAEEQFAGRELSANVCLRAATVATVKPSQRCVIDVGCWKSL